MVIWGVVIAKAKAGFAASGVKDHTSVRSTLTSVIGMTILIGIASFAKLNAENNFIDNWVGNSNS